MGPVALEGHAHGLIRLLIHTLEDTIWSRCVGIDASMLSHGIAWLARAAAEVIRDGRPGPTPRTHIKPDSAVFRMLDEPWCPCLSRLRRRPGALLIWPVPHEPFVGTPEAPWNDGVRGKGPTNSPVKPLWLRPPSVLP